MTAIYDMLVKNARVEVTGPRSRLNFIPRIFATATADTLIANFLRKQSNYESGYWRYYLIPQGTSGNITPQRVKLTTCETGYMAPPDGCYKLTISGNYFEAEVSADAAGIISTLFVLNGLIWKSHEMGSGYKHVCNKLINRCDALKDYVSIVQHPEAEKIFRAID